MIAIVSVKGELKQVKGEEEVLKILPGVLTTVRNDKEFQVFKSGFDAGKTAAYAE